MILPPDLKFQGQLKNWSRWLAFFIISVAVLVLVGWGFDVPLLRRMGTPDGAMNPISATAFLLSTTAFLILTSASAKTFLVRVAYAIAVLIAVLGLVRFGAAIGGNPSAFESWLFSGRIRQDLLDGKTVGISPNAALGLALVGTSLLLLHIKQSRLRYAFQFVAIAILLLSLLSLLSYMYQTEGFFGLFSHIPMALNTAVCFLAFSIAFLFAKPGEGMMAHFTSILSGSALARLLMPAAIIIPAVFGLVRLWGYWQGFYNNEFGVTLYSIVTMICLGAIGAYTVRQLNRRDIRQQRTQEALINSEAETRAVFHNGPDAIIVIDRDGRIIKWNPQSETLFGWTADEVTGELLTNTIIPEEFRDSHQKGMQRYLLSNQSDIIGQTVEIWAVHKNKQPIDVALRISPLTLDGRQYFIGFLRDITEKKQIEERLKNFNRELSKQVEDKVRETTETFNRVTDGFIALDRDFRYTYANKKIGEITGRDPESLLGKNIWEEFPDAVGSATYHAFHKAMKDQEYTFNMDHFPQLDLWQENHIYPGENGLSVFIRDLSEKKRAEREISNVKGLADKLIDSLPGVFYFFDDQGRFIRWNNQFESVTGYSSEEIAGMHPTDFFASDEKQYIRERIQGVFEKGVNDAEANFMTKDGRAIPHYFKATLLQYEGKPCLVGTGIDITEIKKAEELLKLSEQKYKLLFDSNPLPMWMLSLPDYDIIEVNQASLNQYGYTREDFLKLDIFTLRPDDDIEQLRQTSNRNFRGIHYAGVWKHQKRNGDILYVDIVTHDIYYEGKPVRLVLANEVTEQYLAEEKLKTSYDSIRQLTEHLNKVREEERLHIAREIHDELGQLLTVLKMDVSWINKKMNPDAGPIKQKISEVLSLIDTTVKTVRRIASELRPSLIDDLGLVAAMEWHLEEFERRSGIEKEADLPDEEFPLPDSLKIGLFRILQESLTNVARHSGAKKVNVSMIKKDKQLILTIADNGTGFDDNKSNGKTLGLLGMKERTLVMGGDYHIVSKPNEGTTVTVTVPVPA